MRRTDIRHSIKTIRDALVSSAIPEALLNLLRNDDNKIAAIPRLNDYSIKAAHFDKDTNKLVGILGLAPLSDASFWVKLIENDGATGISQLYQGTRFAVEYLPKFADLLEQKGLDEYVEALPKSQQARENVGTISFILLENKNQFSKPERLIELLQSVAELYKGLAITLGESEDSLTVLSCDSGSDKSFDFLGAAKVMQEMRELVIALWDRVVFFKERRLEEQIELVAKGLPVLAQVTELQSTGKIGPEQAEIIRRLIEGGITKFLHAGAIIPEIREHTYHEPRALMTPEKKLLMPPPPAESSQTSPPPQPDDKGHSELDVIRELQARMAKMEQQQTRTTLKDDQAPKRAKPRGKKNAE